MNKIMKQIKGHISSNVSYYDDLKNKISRNINGRVCHHNVEVIDALFQVFNSFSTYVEIGVHNGTSMSYAVSSPRTLNCYGIDLFEYTKDISKNAYRYWENDKIQECRSYDNIVANNVGNSRITLIKGDSTAQKTYNILAEKLGNATIDILFIDGNHDYDYVKSDFLMYTKLLSPSGIVILDDYNKAHPGVYRFAKEIDDNEYELIGVYNNNELILRKF